jgi:hypothetical protein
VLLLLRGGCGCGCNAAASSAHQQLIILDTRRVVTFVTHTHQPPSQAHGSQDLSCAWAHADDRIPCFLALVMLVMMVTWQL